MIQYSASSGLFFLVAIACSSHVASRPFEPDRQDGDGDARRSRSGPTRRGVPSARTRAVGGGVASRDRAVVGACARWSRRPAPPSRRAARPVLRGPALTSDSFALYAECSDLSSAACLRGAAANVPSPLALLVSCPRTRRSLRPLPPLPPRRRLPRRPPPLESPPAARRG